MFEDLLDFVPDVEDSLEFVPQALLSPAQEIDAKYATAALAAGSAALATPEPAAAASRDAFAAMTSTTSIAAQKLALTSVDTPEAVKHLVGMLTAYDWNFVEQASELRGYAVAGILEETRHPEARYRLKALELLGKVTEVALFTERIEVKRSGISDEDLETQLREKLAKFMGAAAPISDAEVVPETI